MKVEAVHQLAVALHSSPKLFACVLGSGVSRPSGIQTGWQILLELVMKHAAQLGEDEPAAGDPALWYARKCGSEPGYSEVVQGLAPTADLRRNLLEPYFTVTDPVTGERREHEPTRAHRAIAHLVQRGLLRVIVTTNFDRLMENALRDAGVAQIEVVSSEEEAANCYPFHACDCFVFKVHGDWKDTRLRNSRAELADYPRPIAKLLRRIVSEHGLIVCGWSAEYDVALRQAIARYQRRFPVFWADPQLGEAAQRILGHLRGERVDATGDEFFEELELAVAALERRRPPAPLGGDVLVARARRWIAEKREMELEDLLQDATRALCRWLEEEFDPTCAPDLAGAALSARMDELAASCEERTAPLARLLTTLAKYEQPSYFAQRCLSELLRSAMGRSAPMRAAGGSCRWTLFSYPALLCAYAHGVACAAQDNWQGAVTAVRDAGSGDAAGELRLPPAGQNRFFQLWPWGPWSQDLLLRFVNRISNWLFPHTQDWIPRRAEFERAFDRFDVMLCVLSLRPDAYTWKPRCSIVRDDDDRLSARLSFDEVERWLSQALDQVRNPESAKWLWAAFADTSGGYPQLMNRVLVWKPKA